MRRPPWRRAGRKATAVVHSPVCGSKMRASNCESLPSEPPATSRRPSRSGAVALTARGRGGRGGARGAQARGGGRGGGGGPAGRARAAGGGGGGGGGAPPPRAVAAPCAAAPADQGGAPRRANDGGFGAAEG